MSEALLNQAAFALQRGDLWRAEYCYREVITRDPGNFEALDALAAVLAQRGRAEDAATLYERALRLKPDDAIAMTTSPSTTRSGPRTESASTTPTAVAARSYSSASIRSPCSAVSPPTRAAPAGLDRALGEVLLEPTRIYARDCLALVDELSADGVHAFAHITGGGLAGNTARVVPEGLEAVLDRATWALPPAVRLLEEHGVPRTESERAFNCGVGMVAAVAGEHADRAVALLRDRGVPAWVAGEVRARSGADEPAARLVGSYR